MKFLLAVALTIYVIGAVIVSVRELIEACLNKPARHSSFLEGLIAAYGWPVDAWLWWRR